MPVDGSSFSTRSAFALDVEGPVTVLAATADEARRAVEGLRSVAIDRIEGYVLGGRPGADELGRRCDELDELVASGATVIDVREKDERDEGDIPGSRNVPYRLMRLCCPDLPRDRPVITICGVGPPAAIAASLLRAKAIDARPVVDGGMNDWLAAGRRPSRSRRCG